MKVLIVKLSSLGDIVHAIPVVGYLRNAYAKPLQIHWLVNDDLAPLVEASRVADKVIHFDRKAWSDPLHILSNMKTFLTLVRQIRDEDYDIAIDLQCLFRSAVIPFLARIPRRAGYDRTREGARFFLNELAQVKGRNFHAVEENLAVVVESFGLKAPDPKSLSLQLSVPNEKEKSVEALLRENALEAGKFILLNPNSRWESKKWGMEKYEDLAIKFLASTDFSIALIGSRGERQAVEPLALLDKRIVNLAGMTDLFELYVLMKKARLLVTNDTGPMHLASAAGLKTVAIFGPTSPERTGPFWQSLVVRSDEECSPCLNKRCPLFGDRNMRCMTKVTVEEVFREALRLIL